MKVAFYTLGCKVNQYETQILKQYFSADGFDIVDDKDSADVYVVNSCTVTATGDKKTRQLLHRFKRQNPFAVLALTGCMPQAFPEDAQVLSDADVITGAYNRKGLLSAVKKSMASGERVVDITKHHRGEDFEDMYATEFLEKTRAFVKIQDGCERYCSYCIIPTARGAFRSKKLDEIKKEITELANKGFKEVVLVGINLSCYGIEYGLGLIDAVKAACAVDGVERVRLGSLEPELLELDYIMELSRLKKFCPQFHLSLQSGSDRTLKRMNRHYTTTEYSEIVDNIRKVFDNPAITTDIMVGFPGETNEEFEQTINYIKELKLSKAHVFAYSRRKGTKAALMPEQIDNKIKVKRSKMLIEITDAAHNEFLKSQIGKTVNVLVETVKNGILKGYSENYTPVEILVFEEMDNNILSPNVIQSAIITDVGKTCCIGKLVL